jgi:predicted transposase YbfD/YdcC
MTLLECLEEVQDSRRLQGQRYSCISMLLLIIMSMLRNKHMYREIGRFCEQHKPCLIELLGFKTNRVPSHVTIRSFIQSTDFSSIQAAFHKWTQHYVSIEAGEWVAVDGKSIRSTASDYSADYQNFVSLVSLFSVKHQQVFQSHKFENKHGSETQTVSHLLEMLDLKGVILTMDALHCKKTLHQIVKSDNHYLVQVKGNQPKLKAAIEETLIVGEPIAYNREEAIVRGRLEIRETYLYARQNNLDAGWESVNLIIHLYRNFLSKHKEYKSDSFYVSDLQTDDARFIAQGIRSHWHIENKLHYTKDVTMREDKECTKNKTAAPILALLRNITFNICKSENQSIKIATEIFANYNVKELFQKIIRT